MEFCAKILARILIEEGSDLIVSESDIKEVLEAAMRERSFEALEDIHIILDEDLFEDDHCYDCIHRIVRLYEDLGPGAGSRHPAG